MEHFRTSYPEHETSSNIEIYQPEVHYSYQEMQAIADVFQDGFPYGMYPLEDEKMLLANNEGAEQIQGWLDEGATWMTARDDAGEIAAILRSMPRAEGQQHINWIITEHHHRQQGFARHLLQQYQDSLDAAVHTVTASIHEDNAASFAIFTSLGYTEVDMAQRQLEFRPLPYLRHLYIEV